MTYNPHSGQLPKFREQGARIFFFSAYACDKGINNLAGLRPFTPSYFIGENQYDFAEIDRTLEEVAPGGKGAYIILRVYLSTPPGGRKNTPKSSAATAAVRRSAKALLLKNGGRICGAL